MKAIHLILGKANPNRMNGVNKVVHSLATHQFRLGFGVEVWGITRTHQELPTREYPLRLFHAEKWPFSITKDLKTAILELGKDVVVHIHGGFIPVFFSITRTLRRLGIPYFLTPHGAYGRKAREKSFWIKKAYFAFFERRLAEGARVIHLLGKSEFEDAEGLLPSNRRVLIPNGHSFDDTSGDAEKKEKPGTPLFGFCGRIDIHCKGLDILLEGFKLYRCSGHSGYLWIVGGGPELSRLRGMANSLGIGDVVVFWDCRFGAEKNSILGSIDAFVHPSRNEGFPMAVLEAAALGKCLIVSKETNFSEFVDQFNCGFTLSQNNPQELAKAFSSVDAGIPSGRIREHGEKARSMVSQEFNWRHIARRIIAAYADSSNDSPGAGKMAPPDAGIDELYRHASGKEDDA